MYALTLENTRMMCLHGIWNVDKMNAMNAWDPTPYQNQVSCDSIHVRSVFDHCTSSTGPCAHTHTHTNKFHIYLNHLVTSGKIAMFLCPYVDRYGMVYGVWLCAILHCQKTINAFVLGPSIWWWRRTICTVSYPTCVCVCARIYVVISRLNAVNKPNYICLRARVRVRVYVCVFRAAACPSTPEKFRMKCAKTWTSIETNAYMNENV